MTALITERYTSFYEHIKNCEGLDLRDNRGKTQPLAIILIGIMIALLRNRDGVSSSIHRAITNTHQALCIHLNENDLAAISRAQLPLILKK